MVLFIIVFCMLVALGFGIASAVSDFRAMTIPNLYSLCIILAFVPAYATDALSGDGVEFFLSWKSHLGAFLLMFAATFLLFSFGLLGAGDSKLVSAFALWTGFAGLAHLVFYMAIAGALLGIATKIMNKKTLFENPAEGGWIAKAQNGANRLPYGIAICVGSFAGFYGMGWFSPEKLALLAG